MSGEGQHEPIHDLPARRVLPPTTGALLFPHRQGTRYGPEMARQLPRNLMSKQFHHHAHCGRLSRMETRVIVSVASAPGALPPEESEYSHGTIDMLAGTARCLQLCCGLPAKAPGPWAPSGVRQIPFAAPPALPASSGQLNQIWRCRIEFPRTLETPATHLRAMGRLEAAQRSTPKCSALMPPDRQS